MTGRNIAELTAEDEGEAERLLVWFTLRRLGFDPTWEEAGDVLVNYVTPDPPTVSGSTSSPPSATTGG